MRYIKINTLPKIKVAHVYGAPSYHHVIPVSPEKKRIEICYVSEGCIPVLYGKQLIHQDKYDLTCNLYDQKTEVQASSFHEHHTVSIEIDYTLCDEQEAGALALPLHLPSSRLEKAHKILDEIIRVYTINPQDRFSLAGLTLQLFSEYDKLAMTTVNQVSFHHSFYTVKAKEYIYTHLHSPITQKGIAEYLNITPEYLCSVFKKATGESLIPFINRIKLSKICDLMEKENLKLYEASEIYGYKDPNYVSRLFKKYHGKNITHKKD